MKQEEIKSMLEKHSKWLNDEPGGKRADLCDADLRYADLRDANLRYADLCDADLRYADLRYANLRGADLRDANLRGADLRDANLRYADLCYADLRYADLRDANLRYADLCYADLRYADLRGAKNVPFVPMACPDSGSYTAFKKVRGNLIVKLEIPTDALRSSATSRKCRASKAFVLAIENMDGSNAGVEDAYSCWDNSFVYRIGKVVGVDNFDIDRWNECAPGIHHFINRQEAVEYEF